MHTDLALDPARRRTRGTRRHGTALAVVALCVALCSAALGAGARAGAQSDGSYDALVPVASTSAFVPLEPVRLYEGDGAPDDPLGGGQHTVPLAAHVPEGTNAIVVNVSALGGAMPIQLCGLRVGIGPTLCMVPYTLDPGYGTHDATAARSLSGTIPIGPERVVRLWAPDAQRVAVDLLGSYVSAAQPVAAGRFRPAAPAVRLFDSRDLGPMVDASTVTVPVAGALPADTSAVAVSVTAVDAERDGYVTAFASGATPPTASNLLVLAPDRTVTNQVVVPVVDGAFRLHSTGRSHLLVDLQGSFTSAASPPGTDGLFVPTLPVSLSLTVEPWSTSFGLSLEADELATIPYQAPIFSPSIGALAVHVQATAEEAGFVTLWGAGSRPWTTTVFLDRPQGRSASAYVPVDGDRFRVASSMPADVTVDAFGYFTA